MNIFVQILIGICIGITIYFVWHYLGLPELPQMP